MTAHPIRARSALARVVSPHKAGTPVDLALAVVRVALAWIFVVYGAQKLFGWFGGPGIDPTAGFMASLGLKPGTFMAYLSGIIEFGGGIAMLLGVVTRLAGLALIGDMVVAMVKVTAEQGLHPYTNAPGYGLNVALIALALVMFLLGAGRYSLDALAERRLAATGEASAS
jgi:putative oxidoreductase